MSEPSSAPPPAPQDDEPPDRSRANVVALVFVALLFAGAVWLFTSIQHHRELENCIASGRHDCIDYGAESVR
jgi:hypothetical protein